MLLKPEAVSRNASRKTHRLIVPAIFLLLGAGILLSGCTTAPDYDPSAHVYVYDYPPSGSLGFDYWDDWPDWHHHWDHDHWDHHHWDHDRWHHDHWGRSTSMWEHDAGGHRG